MNAFGSPTLMVCDLCGREMTPERDAMRLGLVPLVIGGKRAKHARLGCYRLNRELLERGLDPRDYQ